MDDGLHFCRPHAGCAPRLAAAYAQQKARIRRMRSLCQSLGHDTAEVHPSKTRFRCATAAGCMLRNVRHAYS